MTPPLRNLLILLGGIAFVLVLIILFFSSNSRFRLFLNSLLDGSNGNLPEEDDDETCEPVSKSRINTGKIMKKFTASRSDNKHSERPQRVSHGNEDDNQKAPESMVEMATLVQKSDDRLRVIESTGETKLVDEYYELIFISRKGKRIKIECSREAYEKIPFNQQGSLTYRRNRLVKFKYYEDVVYNS